MEYHLIFKNGRSCEIECQETGTPLQDKINRAEQRFGSPVATINGKQVKEHGLGGFLIGTLIGGAVASKTAKKPVKSGSAKKSARAKDRKYVNADEDYETRYSKDKPARKGYANRDVMNLETMKTGGKTKEYPLMKIGVIEPKQETMYTRWHPPIEVYQYANKIWAKSDRNKRIELLKKYVYEFKDLDLSVKDKTKMGSGVPDLSWRQLAWAWQRDIATGLHNSNFGVEYVPKKTYAEGGSVGTGGTMDSSMVDAPTIGGTMASSMYAKGGGVRAQKKYNKEVDAYKWFIVDLENKTAVSGWEFQSDAKDALKDYDGDKNYKVVSEKTLISMGIENPKERFKKMKHGGSIDHESVEMLQIQSKEAKHHAEELSNALKGKTEVEPWVIAKMERATTDLSDITHYLDGQKYDTGGGVEKLNNLEIELYWKGLKDDRYVGKYVVSNKTLDRLEEEYGHAFSIDVNNETISPAISYFDLKKELWSKGRDRGFFAEGGGVESEKRYRILSPDGFDIVFNQHYSKEEVLPAFEEWKKRYDQQGYYSSNQGRISLEDLADEMTVIEDDMPYNTEDDTKEYATGGMIGKDIVYNYYGEQKIGTITEILPSGDYVVHSGMTQRSVSPSDVISEMEHKKKRFSFFKLGGLSASPKKGSDIVGKTMHEFKEGKLRSSSGNIVTNRDQAIAIGLSKERRGYFKEGGETNKKPKVTLVGIIDNVDPVKKTFDIHILSLKSGRLTYRVDYSKATTVPPSLKTGDMNVYVEGRFENNILMALHILRSGYAKGGAIYPDISKIDKPDIIQDQATLFDVEKETPIKDPKDKVTKIPEVDITIERNLFFKGLPKVRNSISAVEILRKFWANQQMNVQEHFYVMLLSQNNKVISVYHQAKGGIASTTADIELTCAVAVKSLARGVIVAHNHPSGELGFSEQDKDLTKKLATALKTLDILLFDSVVVTDEGYISMADDGILPNP